MHAQVEAARGGDRRVLRGELAQQFAGIEIGELRLQRAGVEARDVEQAVEQVLRRAQRGVDALGQVALLGAVCRSRAARRRTAARR